MAAEKGLDGKNYVSVNLLVPSLRYLLVGLNHTLDGLKLPAPADNPVEIVAGKAMVPCVETHVEDLDNR